MSCFLTHGVDYAADYYAPAPNRRGIKRCFCLTSVCLTSVAYIGPKSRTERPRKTKIGTEVAHVTRDWTPLSGSKGQGHQTVLVCCSSHYIMYIDETSFYATALQSEPLPVDRE